MAIRTVSNQYQKFNQLLFNDTDATDYREIKRILKVSETASLAAESLALLIVANIQEYQNDDEKIRDSVREAIPNQRDLFLQASSYITYGFNVGTLKYGVYGGKAELVDVDFLEPELVKFDGTKRQLKTVVYQGDNEYKIPYKPGFVWHLVNQQFLSNDRSPYGFSAGSRLIPLWKAYEIVFSSYVLVAQKQATKLLIAKTDTNAQVTIGETPEGDIITQSNSELMLEALLQTENSSVLVIDSNDDIEIADQSNDGIFFLDAFHQLDTKMFRSYYHPPTYFSTSRSGVGDSNLAETQQESLMMIANAKADHLTGNFIKSVIEPMIRFNHGEQPSYGYYQTVNNALDTLEYAEMYIKFTELLASLLTVEQLTPDVVEEIKAMIAQLKDILQIS